MPAKRWTELSKEMDHDVRRMRYAFFAEHVNADHIEVNPMGIPLKAVYYTPETPGVGQLRDDVPMLSGPPSPKDWSPVHKVLIGQNSDIFLDGFELKGVTHFEVSQDLHQMTEMTITMNVKVSSIP